MPIPCSPLSVLIPFYFLNHFSLTLVVSFPSPYSPIDNVAINCGSAGNLTTPDGRQWIGDIGSKFSSLQQRNRKSVTSKAFHQLSDVVPPVPYMTARFSRSQFIYTFEVSPGQKFIRLHFHPTSYPGFESSKTFFTVKAGPFTLLSNFSASLTAKSLGLKYFVKEFCLNVVKNQALNITFFPSPSSASDVAYAFINGIEIVSMPTGLYYTQGNDPVARAVGQNYRYYIENSTALEVVLRLNVGGSSISSFQDSGMFREWSEDLNYLIEPDVLPILTTIPIKYTSIPAYTAPQSVYQTTWSKGLGKQYNQANNFSWKLSVDLGFRYLVRLHFCELDYEIKERGQREFCIFINNQIAEACADLIEWSGGNGVAVYKDYVVMFEGDRMEGKRDLLVALRPHCHDRRSKHATDPVLNGLEVFKLSNPDNNLAGPNPVLLAEARVSKAPKLQKSTFSFGGGNAFMNGVIIGIILVNILVHQLCVWVETSGNKNISTSSLQGICRRFSLAEMQLATNNFDDTCTIGYGGFGKVYKGLIDQGDTTVAIKRLNSTSKQGAPEFWTEIELLSKLRHTHLVTLIGYCDEYEEMILVYDYMAYGTLADHIYRIRRNRYGNTSLSWEQRLNICIGAARGLNYLHTGTHQRVIHRDVKSTNILLDENWVAKISDFGLSKMGAESLSRSYVSTNVKGTIGYLDPEYFSTRRLTSKSDVYSFGVVLLEVLCGKPAADMRLEEEQQSLEHHRLALWVQRRFREGLLDLIIDPHLKTEISPHSLKVFTEVSIKCLHKDPKDRPTMAEVVGSLELALGSRGSSGSCTQQEAISICGADNNQADGSIQLGGADLQRMGSSQDHTPTSNKRTKSTITKVVQSISLLTRSKDLQRKKAKDNSSESSGSSWWRRRKPVRDGVREIARDGVKEIMKAKRLPAPLEDLCRHFSLAEIREATNNFDDDLIMERPSVITKLYKGYIDDGNLVVAIRRFKTNSLWAAQECWANIEILVKLRHVHILPLIGYCCDEEETILVYNFMDNGSLGDHLFKDSHDPLPWKKRLEICIGAARGLQYLHAGAGDKIIHRNIKSTKILLDRDWVPKVSDFKLATTSKNWTRHIVGSWGYLDPECSELARPVYSGGRYGDLIPVGSKPAQITHKSDVYSFGVLLLEVLSSWKASNPVPHGNLGTLVDWFKSCIKKKCIDQIIDPYLMGRITPECLKEFVKLTWSCLLYDRIKRPSMDEVVGSLQLALLETSVDHIQFSGASHGEVAQSYNDALFCDRDFIFINNAPASCFHARFVPYSNHNGCDCIIAHIPLSTPIVDASDLESSNLAR